jgi:hypothetical protein
MRVVQKALFARLTTAELAHIDEVLEVTSIGVTIGYFVPASMWHEYELALAGADEAQGEGDDGLPSVV